MEKLLSTHQQRACFKTIRKMTILSFVLQLEECWWSSIFYGLQYCSMCIAHMTIDFGCRLSEAAFCWQYRIWRFGVAQWLQNCHLGQVLQTHCNWACITTSVCLCLSRLPSVCFLQCRGEARIGKHSAIDACHDSGIFCICRAWPSATHKGQMERFLLFLLSRKLHFVLSIYYRILFFEMIRHFSVALVHLIELMKMMMMRPLLPIIFLYKISNMALLSSASLTTHMFL